MIETNALPLSHATNLVLYSIHTHSQPAYTIQFTIYELVYLMINGEILRGSPSGASNKRGVGKISSFLSLSVNISKTVAETAKVTFND